MHIFGTDIDLNRNEAKNFRLENGIALPTVGASDSGLAFYHSGLSKFYGWTGAVWIDLGASGGSYSLPTASTTVLGGVKIDGTSITIDGSGIISSSAVSSYTVYTALLSQVSTSAPTAIVLENSVGSIVWSYDSLGQYTGTLIGAFDVLKTHILFGGNLTFTDSLVRGIVVDADTIRITTNVGGTLRDGTLNDTAIEIKIYP